MSYVFIFSVLMSSPCRWDSPVNSVKTGVHLITYQHTFPTSQTTQPMSII